MKFVADDKIPFLKGVLEKAGAEVIYLPGAKIAKENISGADGLIIRTRTICNSKLLEGTSVRFIASATIGYDHIDTEYCAQRGIFWTNAPGCNSSSVAQYITSAILNWACENRKAVSDLQVGIIGVGNVGSKVAKIANILGMKTLLNDPPRERKEGRNNFVPLEKILHEADIITIHVPLQYDGTDKTFHLVDDDFFCEIRKKPFFINSSRGEVVETEALKKAIKKGVICAAAIDVWENEPEIDLELLSLAKFATPHIAGYSTDGKANGTAMSVHAASRFFNLGLENWYPEIPIPENDLIVFNGESGGDAIQKAVNFTYDIRRDSSMLKRTPSAFESLRGNYPLRREFPGYRITDCPEELREIFENLGFKVNK